MSHSVGNAATLARAIVAANPSQYESWFYFDDQGFRGERSRFVGQVYSPARGTTGFLARIKTELDEAQLAANAARRRGRAARRA